MYLATEATRTFTWPEVLLAAFEALALVAAMIWVKVVLYRRRIAEDREEARRHRKPHGAFQAMKRRAVILPSPRPSRFSADGLAARDLDASARSVLTTVQKSGSNLSSRTDRSGSSDSKFSNSDHPRSNARHE